MQIRWWLEKIIPAGPERLSGQRPDESSPARSAGLAFLKSIRPVRGRDDRQMLAIAEPRATPKAECFSIVPTGRTCLLLHFPALRAGLLSLSPSGTKVLTVQLWPLS